MTPPKHACSIATWFRPHTVSADTRHGFATLTFDAYQGTGDAEDIAYTQAFLPGLKNFYRTAAQTGRAAIFTVDQ